MNADFPRYMNFKQALKFFNIGSYNTLYGFIDNEGLPVIKVGNVKRIDQQAAIEWLQSKTVK
ncbi:MAG TPA: helix-turn-helix domain-containing protein [Candidatus Ligilactobacillus excrementavium]|nr:helix-turn-helix domain-containing protein [Candidatus Ligilactobacillus excrementavium]